MDRIAKKNAEKTDNVINTMHHKQKVCKEALENIQSFLLAKNKVSFLNFMLTL